MDALSKITTTAERAMAELNKTSMTQWNSSTVSTIKYIIERLNLCFDEINFYIQKKGLNEEANVLSKLIQHFTTIFQKIDEIHQLKQLNPPELPLEYCQRSFSTNASTKTIFGGCEIQSFSIFASNKAKYISADQEFRTNKPKFKKNVQNRGTDTNDDAIRYLNAEYLSEKERELQRVKEENEMNMREIEKFLKLKGVWSEINASNAPIKLQDLGKTLERELQRNEIFINDQIRLSNQEQDVPPKDMKQEIKEKVIVGVQKQTAERILKYAERKMKEEFDKFQLKKNAGLQMHKRKSQNMSRIDELEHLINAKNEEILEKESKISSLFSKFEEQEKKLVNLMVQMEQMKVSEKQNTFTSNYANDKQYHVEIQVNMIDPKLFKLELQLKEIVDENTTMKSELQVLHEQAKNDKQKVLLQPQLIEEVLLMILQNELQAEGKIDLLQTFLQYLIDNSENDIAKMQPNELYKVVRSKMQQNTHSNRNLEEVLEKFEEMQSDNEEFSPIKKAKKQKNKQPKQKKISLEKADSQAEIQLQSEKQISSFKTKSQFNINEQSNDNTESQIVSNNIENSISQSMFKKKQLNKISEETSVQAKQSPRKQEAVTPQSGSRNVLNNSSFVFKQSQSDSKSNKTPVFSFQNNQSKEQQQPKESSRFRTENKQEQQQQQSSGRQQTNHSRGRIEPNPKITSQSHFSESTPQFQKKMYTNSIKSRKTISDEHGDIDLDEIDDDFANRGVQVNIGGNTMKQSQQQKQDQSNMMGSQIGQQTPNQRQSYRQLEEKVTAKFTQTDDFFMWNLFQKMQVDLGLTEDQIKRLEQIFLNEQQFIHFYEKTPSQQQKSRGSRASTVLIEQPTKVKEKQLNENTVNDSKMTTMIQLKNDTTDSEHQRRPTISIMKTTQPPKGLESPMNLVGRQKSQVLLSYTNESSIMQPGQGRSISQSSDVHIVNYASVSPDGLNKKQRQTTSQKILEDMLKNKVGITTPFEIEQKEQKEQKLYFHVFGDELQTDADFELEAVRANMGKPLEVIQDHLKEEAMKKIYQQFINRPKNPWQDQLYMLVSQYANKPPQQITYIDFKKYYENYMRVHKRCGDGCAHIQRFLARIGFGLNNRRKQLNMTKQSVSPFELPKLK